MTSRYSPDWSDRTVAVTGAGGFIGRRVLSRVVELGAEARGIDLSSNAVERARETGADVRVGDTCNPEDVEALCEGCDVVVHTAAIVGEGGSIERYRSVNVEGTETVARAAASSSVAQLVHLSSVMVYGFDFPPEVDEEGPLSGEGNAYCQTKIESERVARASADSDLDVVVIRPGDVYGPGSQPWVVRPLKLIKQRLFAIPDGGSGKIHPIYVTDVVDAIIRLVERRLEGPFNVTGGRAVPAERFFRYHAEMLGGRWIPTAPAELLRFVFTVAAAGFRMFGAVPPATPDAVDFLNRSHEYADDKIRKTGFEPRIELDEGMRRVERWAQRRGLLD